MHVFLTGCTGYIGGEVLYALTRHGANNLSLSCLVRDAGKAKAVQNVFPNVGVVQGSLDDVGLIQSQAEAADVVLHLAATGHLPSSKAIVTGLQKRKATSAKPPYWIQMSGASLYAADEIANSRFGQPSQLILDDVKDQETILSTIRKLPKRAVDNLVIEQSPEEIKTALIVGPLIYGTGRGPCNTRSIQAPEIAKATLELDHGFKLNEGENIWSNIHVADLGQFIAQLVEAADQGKEGIWNTDGVYNVAVGEMSFKDLSTRIAEEAAQQGLIKADQPLETIDAQRADALSGHASILWGTNARTRSSRAQKLLGWKASAPSLGETIAGIVRDEAASFKASL